MKKKVTITSEAPSNEWLFGGNPGAIEAQEAAGQQELLNSKQLPRRLNSGGGRMKSAVDEYVKMGIKVYLPFEGKLSRIFKEPVAELNRDELFISAELPKGWKLEGTDHSMWNYLKDEKGGKRGSIFYKAAFYDRDAFINLESRYYTQYLKSNDDSLVGKNQYYYAAIDSNTNSVLYTTAISEDIEKTYSEVKNWLTANLPNWEDPYAYRD